jgi:hypothetical protein
MNAFGFASIGLCLLVFQLRAKDALVDKARASRGSFFHPGPSSIRSAGR